MTSLARLAKGALFAPARFVEGASVDDAIVVARLSVATLWLSWGALLVVLTKDGHAPSGPLVLPFERAHAYLAQAALTGPLFVLSALLASMVSVRLIEEDARRDPAAARAWRAHVTTTIAATSLLFLVVPDAVAYAIGGFRGLQFAAPIVLPCFFVGLVVRATRVAREHFATSRPRALLVGMVVAIAHLVVTGPFVR